VPLSPYLFFLAINELSKILTMGVPNIINEENIALISKIQTMYLNPNKE
jgi:hypothetical protein